MGSKDESVLSCFLSEEALELWLRVLTFDLDLLLLNCSLNEAEAYLLFYFSILELQRTVNISSLAAGMRQLCVVEAAQS